MFPSKLEHCSANPTCNRDCLRSNVFYFKLPVNFILLQFQIKKPNLAQIPSPDCNEKPCAAQADFFLLNQSDQRKLLGQLWKNRLRKQACNEKREIASKNGFYQLYHAFLNWQLCLFRNRFRHDGASRSGLFYAVWNNRIHLSNHF